MRFVLLLLIAATGCAARAEPLPSWAGKSPSGETVRIAVDASHLPDHQHLAWPKAVRTADGTIVLGYQAGTHHVDGNSPAVSLSTDGGKTFSPPNILMQMGAGAEYSNSGNMALGLAHDGAVILLSHGHTGNKTNHIFGWRSADNGRTWTRVNTGALGPNKTGSATGSIAQLPGKQLMAVGHYRGGSKPYEAGIWSSISPDDGLTWGEPQLVTNLNSGEPVLVRHEDRLLVFIRGRGPAKARQFVSVSDDWGKTWRTDLLDIGTVGAHANSLAHPFAMVDPQNPKGLLAVTFERPKPGSAQLWRADARKLAFKHERTLVELPDLKDDNHTDFGYAWVVPLEQRRALVFYYHGANPGPCPIWVIDAEL